MSSFEALYSLKCNTPIIYDELVKIIFLETIKLK